MRKDTLARCSLVNNHSEEDCESGYHLILNSLTTEQRRPCCHACQLMPNPQTEATPRGGFRWFHGFPGTHSIRRKC
ncbi:hypothetical protein HanRHA438_Chr02g0049701 [Helianthus annuus]|nr:hypothetical protein HanRHA438_Chr02g0049701 [Helianthus annuus]